MIVKCSLSQAYQAFLQAKKGFVPCLALGSLVIGAALFLAGCGGGSQNANNPAAGAMPSLNAIAGSADGAVILLAKDLLASNVNPFLSKLPITADAKEELEMPPGPIGGDGGGGGDSAQMPADPFDGVTLVGVSYQPKNSYALISSNGGVAQVLREGDVMMAGNGTQLKVNKIYQDHVDLKETSGGFTLRTLMLPDIIGYTNATGGAAAPEAVSDGDSARPKLEKRKSDAGAPAAGGKAEEKAPIIKLEE